jgi:hypothetical protein
VRIQFLVAAHRDPELLSRLCARLLDAPNSAVTVQWDCASPVPALDGDLDIDVRPTRRPCEWGSGAQLDAMLDSLRSIERSPFDWLVVLSGHDYPIRPLDDLAGMLADTSFELFLEPEDGPMPPAQGPEVDYLRDRYCYRYYWLPQRWWSRLPDRSRRVVGGGLQRTARMLVRSERVRVQRRPGNVFSPGIGTRVRHDPFTAARPCWKGSDWFLLSRRVFDDLLCESSSSAELVDDFRHSYCPNEAFFHTLLLPRWEHANAGHNLHHLRFIGASAHPETIDERDWPELVGSKAFFARKFDPSDIALLDRIDRELLLT